VFSSGAGIFRSSSLSKRTNQPPSNYSVKVKGWIFSGIICRSGLDFPIVFWNNVYKFCYTAPHSGPGIWPLQRLAFWQISQIEIRLI
jgi:hypothetical protein